MKGLALLTGASLATLALVACGGGVGGDGGGGQVSGQATDEVGVNPAHEELLNALPTYPGSVRDGLDVTNGSGSFASFWVKGSPELVSSFYDKAVPGSGWQAVSGPTTLPTKRGSQTAAQTAQTFTKGKFILTIYV